MTEIQHGFRAYKRGACACERCRAANARYEAKRELDIAEGRARKVLSVGSVRKVHALQWLGYSQQQISAGAGVSNYTVSTISLELCGTTIYRSVAEKIDAFYKAHAWNRVTLTGKAATTARTRARAQNWAPPMAWEDIDDPRDRARIHYDPPYTQSHSYLHGVERLIDPRTLIKE